MNACDISLYGIIDPDRTNGRPILDLVGSALRGGITLLQYRDKQSDTRTLVENARALKLMLRGSGVPLLLNDRVDVALAADADGVHIGQSDMAPADARALLGNDAIIGLTLKNTDHAADAPIEMLDYVCAGGVFTTLSKHNPSEIGLNGWREIADVFRQRSAVIPIGAIAGIDEKNIGSVIKNGADGAAIISAIFMADDVEATTARLKKIITETQK